MKKFCVFCGNKPENKTSEHILPMWLLTLTGDPSRIVNLVLNKVGKISERKYSFDSFKFPACQECNAKFSTLESEIKNVFSKLFENEILSLNEIDKLFDWFDKVRIGLWLAFYMLDQNISEIIPNFYINQRISQWDRVLHISKVECDQKGLSFVGCDNPSFSFTPSCFGLIVNNLYFLNVSYDFLFSRRIGFPFPVSKKLLSNSNAQSVDIDEGLKRIMKPLIRKKFKYEGIELYQPVFSKFIQDPKMKTLYDNEYVHKNSLDWGKGKGKIFYYHNNEYLPILENINEFNWNHLERFNIHHQHALEVLDWQIFINDLYPAMDELEKNERKRIKKLISFCNSTNRRFIKLYNEKNEIRI